jgi:hypothetical protein
VVEGGVAPVEGSFVTTAIRGAFGQGQGQRAQGFLENLSGQLGTGLENRQRSQAEAAVADLVPVIRRLHPPAEFPGALVGPQAGLEAFIPDGPGQDGPLLRRPGVVEPVVGNGKGMRHLGGIQKVIGVPVGKPGGRVQFLPEALGIAVAALQPLEERQEVNPAQHGPAGFENHRLAPFGLIAAGRIAKNFQSLLPQLVIPLPGQVIFTDELFYPGKVVRRHQQAGMGLFDLSFQKRLAGDKRIKDWGLSLARRGCISQE